ncbi:MAG: hypothetical protein HY794_13400 [Desulfarculus sp.]|nr:hypothetical protein [Desulfarculus sp.]
MSEMDPIADVRGVIQGHIYAGIKLARALPDVIAGKAALQALAASLAGSCLLALGLPQHPGCHDDLATVLGIAPGPDRRERLLQALAGLPDTPSVFERTNGGRNAGAVLGVVDLAPGEGRELGGKS